MNLAKSGLEFLVLGVFGISLVATPAKAQETIIKEISGRSMILGTWQWDIETDRLSGEPYDLWWEQVTESERYLTPQNGAQLAKISGKKFDEVNLDFIRSINLSSDKISGSDENSELLPGAVLAVRTAEGNWAKLEVVGYRALHDFELGGAEDLLWTEWKELALSQSNTEHYHIQIRWVLYSVSYNFSGIWANVGAEGGGLNRLEIQENNTIRAWDSIDGDLGSVALNLIGDSDFARVFDQAFAAWNANGTTYLILRLEGHQLEAEMYKLTKTGSGKRTATVFQHVPILNIARSGSGLQISWSKDSSGFRLETASDSSRPQFVESLPLGWIRLETAPSISGNSITVQLNASDTWRFFRLVAP